MKDIERAKTSNSGREKPYLWRGIWAATCIGLVIGCGFLNWPSALFALTLPVWIMAFRETFVR